MTDFVWTVEFTANVSAVEAGFSVDDAVIQGWIEEFQEEGLRVGAKIVSGPDQALIRNLHKSRLLGELVAKVKQLRKAQRELSGTLHTPALAREKTREIESLTQVVDDFIRHIERGS